MAWVRIDDGLPLHPKMATVGVEGFALYVAAICYSNRYLTDGYIPQGVAGTLVAGLATDDAVALAKRLEQVGSWDAVEDGWRIHDYLDFQPSKTQILKERKQARERMDSARSGKLRPNTPPGEPNVPENFAGTSAGVRPNFARTSGNPTPKIHPNPTEQEHPKGTSLSPRNAIATVPDGEFETFWSEYPARDGKKVGKGMALKVWKRMSQAKRDLALAAVANYAAADRLPKDAFRWLRDESWVDWQTPATRSSAAPKAWGALERLRAPREQGA